MERFEIYQKYVEQSKGEPLNTKDEMGNEKLVTGETLDLNEIKKPSPRKKMPPTQSRHF